MIDMKPYGAFLENTLRPLIEDFRWFLFECEQRGLKVTEQNISQVLKKLATLHIITTVIEAIKQIILLGIVCMIIYLAYQ